MDPEPPRPQWLVQSDLLTTFATLAAAESSQVDTDSSSIPERAPDLLAQLIENLDNVVPLVSFTWFYLVFIISFVKSIHIKRRR